MNKVITLFLAFVSLGMSSVIANDSCTVLFNKHVIFEGKVEQENAVAAIKTKKFKSTDRITIRYSTESPVKGWKRTFYLDAADDRSVKVMELNRQSGSVSVKASVLNEMKDKRQPVFIHTISLPIDKRQAARIRVRRMFICKIEWN